MFSPILIFLRKETLSEETVFFFPQAYLCRIAGEYDCFFSEIDAKFGKWGEMLMIVSLLFMF